MTGRWGKVVRRNLICCRKWRGKICERIRKNELYNKPFILTNPIMWGARYFLPISLTLKGVPMVWKDLLLPEISQSYSLFREKDKALRYLNLKKKKKNCNQKFFFFFYLGLHLQHMEVPRLGVESELQLPAYTTATARQDLSCICNLHQSSRQSQILNPLSKERDQTRVLMDTIWVHYCWVTTGTPSEFIFKKTTGRLLSLTFPLFLW